MKFVRTKGARVALSKAKTSYQCAECGALTPKWQGQCPECGAWNSLAEIRSGAKRAQQAHYAGAQAWQQLSELEGAAEARWATGLGELDRVLGGGLVAGSAVLIGGDPGIGKSTLLLAALAGMAKGHPVSYVTGEESLQQIALRAQRLGLAEAPVTMLAETSVEAILAGLAGQRPRVLVVDSIQTLFSEALESAPGTVSQLRECAGQLVRFAKESQVAVFLVGHVTKEGTLAGPRVLEHMVDAVLYFESDSGSRLRIVRAVKNRFGAANEMGVFAMTDGGFKEVRNPSAIFLARRTEAVAGSAVAVTREGSRPILVEVQALVDQGQGGYPKRIAQGLDGQRLALLTAVLHRHAGAAITDQDVFANVVGGMRVSEPALDLPLAIAILSSLRDRPVPSDTVLFGELGLTGEVRPVPFGLERLQEAAKHGFGRAVVPRGNASARQFPQLALTAVETLSQALEAVFG